MLLPAATKIRRDALLIHILGFRTGAEQMTLLRLAKGTNYFQITVFKNGRMSPAQKSLAQAGLFL